MRKNNTNYCDMAEIRSYRVSKNDERYIKEQAAQRHLSVYHFVNDFLATKLAEERQKQKAALPADHYTRRNPGEWESAF